MEYLVVKNLEKIYEGNSEDFCYTYYIDPLNGGRIYLEYDILCDANYIYQYSLEPKGDVWLFVEKSQVTAGCGVMSRDPRFELAGNDRTTAVDFLITKILEKPEKHPAAGVNTAKLRLLLQQTLWKHYELVPC